MLQAEAANKERRRDQGASRMFAYLRDDQVFGILQGSLMKEGQPDLQLPTARTLQDSSPNVPYQDWSLVPNHFPVARTAVLALFASKDFNTFMRV